MLLWGMGGKAVSEGVGVETVAHKLVLSLGTGCSASPSDPLCLSIAGGIRLGLGIGFCSAPSPQSSFLLDTCLSLGTGFGLALGEGLQVSLSPRVEFSSLEAARGPEDGGSLDSVSPGSPTPCALSKLDKIRLR